MRYRTVPTPPPPTEADIDTPDMADAAAFLEGGEEQLAMLADLARYGMELARAQRDYAAARLAAAGAEGASLNAGEDPAAGFNKIAQTVRRTIALRMKLEADLEKRRAGLAAARAGRRARQATDRAAAVKDAIDSALIDVFHADLVPPPFDPNADHTKPDPREIERAEMLDDAEFLLEDLEEFADWLTAPVGETVAKLCTALGLARDACVRRGDAWLVRRPPTSYETIREQKAVATGSSP